MGEGNGDVVVVPGRFDRSPTLGQLAAAMARAQMKFESIGKDKQASVSSKRTGATYTYAYADLETCLQAVRPALNAEGIALFQPTSIRVDPDGRAWGVATTLLVLGEEWITSEYASPVVDVTDAQACGSACTYARRYGGLGLFGVFPADEDDDAQAARGGAHEMAKSKEEPACPACGVVGSIMKGAAQYGGGILCWVKRGGCGVKWPAGTDFPPTSPPPIDPDPTSGKKNAKKDPKPPAAAPRDQAATTAQPVRAPAATAAGSPAAGSTTASEMIASAFGSDDCETEGCWGPKGHEGDHVFDPATGGRGSEQTGAVDTAAGDRRGADVQASAAAAETPASPVTRFQIGKSLIETAGMTQQQFEESVLLSTAIDKGPLGKGYARQILGKILGKPAEESTRKELTEEKAVKYLAALKQAAAGGEQAELAP